VLDLYAGTGALGIEALSRGAREAVFVERARGALKVLRRNLDELELSDRARVVEADLERGLRALAGKLGSFDLVLADPPYESGAIAKLLGEETLANVLEPDGILVVERSVRDEAGANAAHLRLCGSKRYGETAFDWWECAAAAAVASEALA
jgi:16S rRNA (guanine966-N2)-methyltransferase